MASNVPAVGSAIRIVERLSSEWPDPVSPRVLVSELGLNRSTCYNILATLQVNGWVRSIGDRGGWTLGPKLLTLTKLTDDIALNIALEEIEQLSRRLGFLVFIAEPDGSGGFVVVGRAEQRRGVRVTVGVGDNFPFSAPALMYAYYAWQDEQYFRENVERLGVTQYTPYTLTGVDDVNAELELTRERGYSVSIQQYDLSQSGVAAPVFDHRGKVVWVLCSLAFSSELNRHNIDRSGELLAECGMRISERIYGVAPEPDQGVETV